MFSIFYRTFAQIYTHTYARTQPVHTQRHAEFWIEESRSNRTTSSQLQVNTQHWRKIFRKLIFLYFQWRCEAERKKNATLVVYHNNTTNVWYFCRFPSTICRQFLLPLPLVPFLLLLLLWLQLCKAACMRAALSLFEILCSRSYHLLANVFRS